MFNAVKAYLKTEGKVSYRNFEIGYYTYSMFDVPDKFRVNVNVHIHSPKSDSVKSLALNDVFNKENDAINFGIDKGKAYIDIWYDSRAITDISAPVTAKKSKTNAKN